MPNRKRMKLCMGRDCSNYRYTQAHITAGLSLGLYKNCLVEAKRQASMAESDTSFEGLISRHSFVILRHECH